MPPWHSVSSMDGDALPCCVRTAANWASERGMRAAGPEEGGVGDGPDLCSRMQVGDVQAEGKIQKGSSIGSVPRSSSTCRQHFEF
jgi:hypothetical protein